MERKITIEEHVLYKEDYQMKMLKSLLRVRLQMCLPTTLKSAFCLTI